MENNQTSKFDLSFILSLLGIIALAFNISFVSLFTSLVGLYMAVKEKDILKIILNSLILIMSLYSIIYIIITMLIK